MKIHPPCFFSEKGRRANNEDAVYPYTTEALADATVFIVCDGVGGASKGEVASQISAQTIWESLNKQQNGTKEAIQTAIKEACVALATYLSQHPEAKGMGTTLTCLQLHSNGVTIGHVGDSRVYHLRGNKVLFYTRDHSQINLMIDQGIMNEAEAKLLGKTNVITRAIQASDGTTLPEPEVQQINDVQEGDYFLLCSDGTWECFEEEEFLSVFNHIAWNNEQKMEHIRQVCQQNAKDNYSAILVQIESIPEPIATLQDATTIEEVILHSTILKPNNFVSLEAKPNTSLNFEEPLAENGKKKKKGLIGSLLALTTLLLFGAWYFFYNQKSNGNINTATSITFPIPTTASAVLSIDSTELKQKDSIIQTTSAPIDSPILIEKKPTLTSANVINSATVARQNAEARSAKLEVYIKTIESKKAKEPKEDTSNTKVDLLEEIKTPKQ
jgi:PPM family protein phosphatase